MVNRIVATEQDSAVFMNAIKLPGIRFAALKGRIGDWSSSRKVTKACLKKLYEIGTEAQQVELVTEQHETYPKLLHRLSRSILQGQTLREGLVYHYAQNIDEIFSVIAVKGF